MRVKVGEDWRRGTELTRTAAKKLCLRQKWALGNPCFKSAKGLASFGHKPYLVTLPLQPVQITLVQ